MKFATTALVLILLTLSGCTSSQSAQQQAQSNQINDSRDPIEPLNRELWDFNWNVLDKHIMRPVAKGYAEYMPTFARKGLYNAALNLEEPASTLNNLLQGKVSESAVSFGRFVINTTLGLFGTIDIASDMGLERKEESFSEVLGVWGAGSGPYLMLPAAGPTDVRNLSGDFVDSAYFPMDGLNLYFSILRWTIVGLETRVSLMDQEQLMDGAVDPYALVRDVYFQRQQAKVKDGKVEVTKEEKALEEDIDAYLDDL